MFERFTPEARNVVVLAQEESRTLRHGHIGTEHLLLGLLGEPEGVAGRVLGSFGITAERMRAEVVEVLGYGEESTAGQIPFTPRAKKTLELSLREALNLGHNHIGPEHLLLGLLREHGGVATLLFELDANSEQIREEVIRTLPGPGHAGQGGRPLRQAFDQLIDPAWLGSLGAVLNGLASGIRRERNRAPDTADLLLVLACADDTLAGRLLNELGIGLDHLQALTERVRADALVAEEQLDKRLTELRQQKQQAIDAEQYETVAQIHAEEKRLLQPRDDAVLRPGALQEIRRRLGIT